MLCLVTYGQSFPCFQTMQYLSVNVMMPFLINFQIFLILTRGCKRGLALKQTSMSASLIANLNKSDGQKKWTLTNIEYGYIWYLQLIISLNKTFVLIHLYFVFKNRQSGNYYRVAKLSKLYLYCFRNHNAKFLLDRTILTSLN